MIAEPPPEGDAAAGGRAGRPGRAVPGACSSRRPLTGSIAARRPLTEAERARPWRWPRWRSGWPNARPSWPAGWRRSASAVREESWGLGAGPPLPRQQASELFLHEAGAASRPSSGCKVEFAPWLQAASATCPTRTATAFPRSTGAPAPSLCPDEARGADPRRLRRQGAGRGRGARLGPQARLVLVPLVQHRPAPAGPGWPDDQTEAEVQAASWAASRGGARRWSCAASPQGKAIYNVFLVKGVGPQARRAPRRRPSRRAAPTQTPGKPTPGPDPRPMAIEARAGRAAGRSWERWRKQVPPFQAVVRKQPEVGAGRDQGAAGSRRVPLLPSGAGLRGRAATSRSSRATRTRCRSSCEWKDVPGQAGGRLPVRPRAHQGGGLPDKLDPAAPALVGQGGQPLRAQAAARSLAEAGRGGGRSVAAVPAARAAGAAGAELSSARTPTGPAAAWSWPPRPSPSASRRYPWYRQLARTQAALRTPEATFTRYGDLHSRLREAEKGATSPKPWSGSRC